VAELRARTIVEAHLFLDLLRAEGALGDPDPGDPDGWTTLVEGPQEWTLHADGAGGAFAPFDVTIAYRDLAEARRTGVRFGPRVSTLIDAAQWQELGAEYAEQAIEAGLAAAGAPGDRHLREEAVLSWQFAVDVAAEALRFLPDGADELPDSAFWSDRGRAVRRADPGRFTRSALVRRVEVYQQLRDDLLELLGEAGDR
jgi:hypothetical protein